MHDRTTHITLSPLTIDGTRLEPVAVCLHLHGLQTRQLRGGQFTQTTRKTWFLDDRALPSGSISIRFCTSVGYDETIITVIRYGSILGRRLFHSCKSSVGSRDSIETCREEPARHRYSAVITSEFSSTEVITTHAGTPCFKQGVKRFHPKCDKALVSSLYPN